MRLFLCCRRGRLCFGAQHKHGSLGPLHRLIAKRTLSHRQITIKRLPLIFN